MSYHDLQADRKRIETVALRVGTEARCFTVVVGDEIFGLPVDSVQTIFQVDSVTPIPLGPREILGLVNLRGKIVTAVSLRRRLQIPDRHDTGETLAIGIEQRGENFALVVDEVGDVIPLSESARIPLPPHLDGERAKLTAAFYRLEDRILPILDMNAVFEFSRKA